MFTVAVEVAQEAAAFVRNRRSEVFGGHGAERVAADDAVAAKSTPTDPVTIVDTESEALIRRRIAELRPGDAFLGEEGGPTGSVDGVRWVVDPIDGTVNFLYGVPAYAVSVAAQVDGKSVAGAVVDVARGVTYCAELGHGATRIDADGTTAQLRCTPIESVSMALVATGFAYGAGRRVEQGRLIGELLPRIRDIRRIGSAALDLCMVAAGVVDAHYEHGLSPWDWAAGALIAAEAGAVVHIPGPDSTSKAGEVTVASAPGIAAELTALLRDIGAYDAIPD
ncbi:inositol monophosphatase [Antrihabitans sp. YC2-6]|nr:inositol monophosphatase [Antrihabitans sp. YC2-6]